MARDKLITIRIEGEKRQAFGDLAKSQNSDTASVLYDFISGCLDGKIDIGIVTGKKQWIDKIDNQLDSDRIDRLEATTQEIDNRLDKLSKKLTDWVVSFDDCLNDCDRELSEKINNLEHRLSTLAIQLDSQQIDTDSQQIDSRLNESIARLASCLSQRLLTLEKRLDDVEQLLRLQRECSIATSPIVEPTGETSPLPTIEETVEAAIETVATVETADKVETAIETVEAVTDTVEAVTDTVESVEPISTIELDKGAIETDDREWLTLQQVADKKIKGLPGTHQGLRPYAEKWESRKNPTKKGKQYKIPKEYL